MNNLALVHINYKSRINTIGVMLGLNIIIIMIWLLLLKHSLIPLYLLIQCSNLFIFLHFTLILLSIILGYYSSNIYFNKIRSKHYFINSFLGLSELLFSSLMIVTLILNNNLIKYQSNSINNVVAYIYNPSAFTTMMIYITAMIGFITLIFNLESLIRNAKNII